MIHRSLTSILLLFVAHSVAAGSVSSESVQQRMSEDVAAGKPLVAHLVAYIGHNGLMDFASPAVTEPVSSASARSSVVLACRSRKYFSDLLVFKQSHSLLTTNGLMAPEAYTLETAISVWFSGKTSNETRNSAADTYADYQKANKSWSRSLFATDE